MNKENSNHNSFLWFLNLKAQDAMAIQVQNGTAVILFPNVDLVKEIVILTMIVMETWYVVAQKISQIIVRMILPTQEAPGVKKLIAVLNRVSFGKRRFCPN